MKKIPHITESVLLDYFNGKLSVSEEKEILEWKEACEENRRLFESVRKENLVMRQVVRARLIKGDYSLIRDRIGGKRRQMFKWWHGVAAAIVVGVLVSTIMLWHDFSGSNNAKDIAYVGTPAQAAILELADGNYHYLRGNEIEFKEQDGTQVAISSGKVVYDRKTDEDFAEEEENILYNKITIPRGAGLYRVVLNDGSVIWLNSDSRLEYPEKFGRGERRVRVTGEAFFDVVRDTMRPFVVETEWQSVKVLGTEFNVSAYPSEPVMTTLVSGKVRVMPVIGVDSVVLSPGEQSVLGANVENYLVRRVKVNDVVAWKDGIINIEDKSLSEILKIVSRAYDVDFELVSVRAGDIVLRGSISSDESLEVFLAVLSKVADVKFKMRADGKIEVEKLE